MKRKPFLALALALTLALTACGGGQGAVSSGSSGGQSESGPVELIVFAAASMTETLTEISENYKSVAPNVTLVFNFASSGDLKTQIQEGAQCDLFISAAQKQMNQLDAADTAGQNTEGLDFVLSDTRVDLLENKVALVVPEGNPANVRSFEDVVRVPLVALGNSDVPVGQYSEEIFTALGLWDQLNREHKITFGTNVKEVTSQVSEAAVDCGVVYGTDACSAGLEVVAYAPEGTHSPVIYPAAVLNITRHEEEARVFLEYLQGEEAGAVFEAVGFSVVK